MGVVDIGVNLTHDSFDADREAVIGRALDARVDTMIITGSTVESSRAGLALARRHPGVLFATAGIHPHHAAQADSTAPASLRELYSHSPVVAIGECGLDHFRNFSPREDQERIFRQQLELAVELEAPVFLHQRDAHEHFIGILQEYRPSLTRGVAHCFTGGAAELEACLELDLYIGITGWICDERRGAHLKPLIRRIPADRLMIETDAPYLLPRDLHPKPGTRRNEPMHLPHILATVAAAAGRQAEEIAAETADNARRFFALGE